MSDLRYASRVYLLFVIMPCVALLLVAVIAMAAKDAPPQHGTTTPQRAPRVCYPPAKWGPAEQKFRPCVRIVKVAEDGSFSFIVADHDGTVRYTSAVGALDR